MNLGENVNVIYGLGKLALCLLSDKMGDYQQILDAISMSLLFSCFPDWKDKGPVELSTTLIPSPKIR